MIIPALARRGAVKHFDPQASLESRLIDLILEAGRLAPSAFGLQPHRMLLITDKEKRLQLAPHCFNQPQVTDSAALIVGQAWQSISVSDIEHYMTVIAEQRDVPRDDLQPFYDMLAKKFLPMGQQELLSWSTHQAYLSLGMMLAAAAVENVESSPMEGFNPDALDKALGTPPQYRSVFLLALGYRSPHDERSRWPRVRRSTDNWVARS